MVFFVFGEQLVIKICDLTFFFYFGVCTYISCFFSLSSSEFVPDFYEICHGNLPWKSFRQHLAFRSTVSFFLSSLLMSLRNNRQGE